MLADLAALAPSLIVAAGFLAGVYLLLRRELAPRWRGRAGTGRGAGASPAADMPAYPGISDQEDAAADASSDDEQPADQPGGTRSR